MTDETDEVSLKCLYQDRDTIEMLSTLLNPIKILSSPKGLPRDWRGIASLAGIEGQYYPHLNSCEDKFAKVLDLWISKKDSTATVGALCSHLKDIDRYDVYDDIKASLVKAAQLYLNQKSTVATICRSKGNFITYEDSKNNSIQKYHAFVLFADEDIDFVSELISRMKVEGFRLCTKDDLAIGFATEYDPIARLITERCEKIILVLSPEFLNSSVKGFYMYFAQALGIEKNKVMLIPIVYKTCEIPTSLHFYHRLHYDKPGLKSICNFWDKLSESIRFESTLICQPVKTELDTSMRALNFAQPEIKADKNDLIENYAPRKETPCQSCLKVPPSQLTPDNSSLPSKSQSYVDLQENNFSETSSVSTISLNKDRKRSKMKIDFKKVFKGLKFKPKRKVAVEAL